MFLKCWECIRWGSIYKPCLGMKNHFIENPLRMWKPLGGVWKSSLKFFNKDGELVETFGNEKEKEEVYLGGAIIFVWANMMKPVWLSSPFSFSLLAFVLIWSLFTSCNIMVLLFGKLAAMCPKPKHLKHFIFRVLVGDLVVEVER